MDNRKVFSKIKRTGDPDTKKRNMQPRYMNGIWHRKMCHANNEGLEKTSSTKNITAKSGKY